MGAKVIVIDENSAYYKHVGYVCDWKVVEVDFSDEQEIEVTVNLIQPDRIVVFYDFQLHEMAE